jgi:CheY-like chemotaxis protein
LLSVIVNGLGVLQQRLQAPEDVRVLDAMARATARGAALTQQLLTFARQQPLKQENHNLNSVIGSFEAVLRRAGKGSVRIELALAPDLPLVHVDAAQFEAALLNLIVNARDATPDDGRITLRTESVQLAPREVGTLPAGAYVKVSVQDTGSGMSKDTVTRAIEPFFTTKPVGQGTGLGLSQAYGLAQQSGGDLQIESTLGEGTTVSLYFPALAAEDGATGSSANLRDKALVVDDQEDVLNMAVELFSALGYEVLSANNGADALDILKRSPDIDVLFSDVVMPGMSGIDLAGEARVLAPKMKIILVSGYSSPALAEQNANAHQFDVITKPYTMSQILRRLRASA